MARNSVGLVRQLIGSRDKLCSSYSVVHQFHSISSNSIRMASPPPPPSPPITSSPLTPISKGFLHFSNLPFLQQHRFLSSPSGKLISPVIGKLSEEYPHVTTYKIDIDEEDLGKTLSELNITSVPTFHFFQNGKKAAEVIGADGGLLKGTMEKLYKGSDYYRVGPRILSRTPHQFASSATVSRCLRCRRPRALASHRRHSTPESASEILLVWSPASSKLGGDGGLKEIPELRIAGAYSEMPTALCLATPEHSCSFSFFPAT
ncbi:Thioredoxin O1 [Morus notabilis]|uniref:Thioredoxin O1 n=1 Tax=Morus notabilis TaxID=981085 RepID=W9R4T1_9ROSA|nr:Thioredoxin O1 [Morus notabilis]